MKIFMERRSKMSFTYRDTVLKFSGKVFHLSSFNLFVIYWFSASTAFSDLEKVYEYQHSQAIAPSTDWQGLESHMFMLLPKQW